MGGWELGRAQHQGSGQPAAPSTTEKGRGTPALVRSVGVLGVAQMLVALYSPGTDLAQLTEGCPQAGSRVLPLSQWPPQLDWKLAEGMAVCTEQDEGLL